MDDDDRSGVNVDHPPFDGFRDTAAVCRMGMNEPVLVPGNTPDPLALIPHQMVPGPLIFLAGKEAPGRTQDG
jgi:hypothetical protein